MVNYVCADNGTSAALEYVRYLDTKTGAQAANCKFSIKSEETCVNE